MTRIRSLALTLSAVLLNSCGLPDDSLAPDAQDPEVPVVPVPPQPVGSLQLTRSHSGAFVGVEERITISAYTPDGRNMNAEAAIVTSSNPSVVEVAESSIYNVYPNPGVTKYTNLSQKIRMVSAGKATVLATLRGVTGSIVIEVGPLPPHSTALVVDTFTVVEYRVCGNGNCPYLGYAPLLRLREPTGSTFTDVMAVEFSVPTRTTGWCPGEMRFVAGQSAHVNGVDPYPWNNDMVFFQINGAPLPDGPATARIIVRDSGGNWGLVEATAPIQRMVANPNFPVSPINAWGCVAPF